MNTPALITITHRLEASGRSGYKALREGDIPTDITIGLMSSDENVLEVLHNMKNAGMLDADTPINFRGEIVR